eukprot:TRINITY_DN4325_c0_g1_i4.p1 TRINITY_DN4325_c0_g1~~TRINITY_DN4325_c0_g1_i4.p1  ORF type:complete len:232 (-),score=42.36 TRINITY_DN4325_c0_g1_i4:62-697(-)
MNCKHTINRVLSNSLLRPSLLSPQSFKAQVNPTHYRIPSSHSNTIKQHIPSNQSSPLLLSKYNSTPFSIHFQRTITPLLPSQSIQAAYFSSKSFYQSRKDRKSLTTKETKKAVVIDSKTGTEILSKDRFPRNHARPGDPGRKYRSKQRARMAKRVYQTKLTHKIRKENQPRRSPTGVNPKFLPKQKMPTPRLEIKPYVPPQKSEEQQKIAV